MGMHLVSKEDAYMALEHPTRRPLTSLATTTIYGYKNNGISTDNTEILLLLQRHPSHGYASDIVGRCIYDSQASYRAASDLTGYDNIV